MGVQRGIRIILGLQLLFSRQHFYASKCKTTQLLLDPCCATSGWWVWIWVEIIWRNLASLPFYSSTRFEFPDFYGVNWRANTHSVILMRLLWIKPHFVFFLAEHVVYCRETVWRLTVSAYACLGLISNINWLRHESTPRERHICADSPLAVFPPLGLNFKTWSDALIVQLEFNLLTFQNLRIV